MDAYRWCTYCGADCWLPEGQQEHRVDCPEVTGLHPVDEHLVDLKAKCGRCEDQFVLGDVYVHVPIQAGGANVVELVCLGCAAQEAMRGEHGQGQEQG